MNDTIARSNMYALLSRIWLQEVDEPLLKTLLEDDTILEFFPHWKGWSRIDECTQSQLIEEDLNPDFTNLTVLHLVPYETFYTREDQMIETGGANPVTDIYSAYDFIVDFAVARVVSPDHIGIELEFMHHLCEAQIKALEANDHEASNEMLKVQHEFLNKHLLKWAPMFYINAKYEARTPLYYDAAETALEFILSDNELLSSQV